jgi:hypothetical protein
MAPNVFILGAARCGTTSLHAILSQHSEIHTSSIKEPNFFNWPHQAVRNPLAYFHLFDSSRRYRVDASTGYFTSPATPLVLHSLFPDARFIVSLRNPKSRAYSHYRLVRSLGIEELPTFAEALKAEGERHASRKHLQTSPLSPFIHSYCYLSLYDEHLTRYLELFAREQFHVISLADLSRDPVGTTKEILRFLDLDPVPAESFNFSAKNGNDPSGPPIDCESDTIMTSMFGDLTKRTERVVGYALDWSM